MFGCLVTVEQDSEVNVFQGCFTEGGESILGTFFAEPVWMKLQDKQQDTLASWLNESDDLSGCAHDRVRHVHMLPGRVAWYYCFATIFDLWVYVSGVNAQINGVSELSKLTVYKN